MARNTKTILVLIPAVLLTLSLITTLAPPPMATITHAQEDTFFDDAFQDPSAPGTPEAPASPLQSITPSTYLIVTVVIITAMAVCTILIFAQVAKIARAKKEKARRLAERNKMRARSLKKPQAATALMGSPRSITRSPSRTVQSHTAQLRVSRTQSDRNNRHRNGMRHPGYPDSLGSTDGTNRGRVQLSQDVKRNAKRDIGQNVRQGVGQDAGHGIGQNARQNIKQDTHNSYMAKTPNATKMPDNPTVNNATDNPKNAKRPVSIQDIGEKHLNRQHIEIPEARKPKRTYASYAEPDSNRIDIDPMDVAISIGLIDGIEDSIGLTDSTNGPDNTNSADNNNSANSTCTNDPTSNNAAANPNSTTENNTAGNNINKTSAPDTDKAVCSGMSGYTNASGKENPKKGNTEEESDFTEENTAPSAVRTSTAVPSALAPFPAGATPSWVVTPSWATKGKGKKNAFF